MAILQQPTYLACDESDPDDYRPRSTWAFLVDPADTQRPFVKGLALSIDNIAPGDRVPLHHHPIDEALVVLEGTVELIVGDQVQLVGAGGVAFAPAGVAHGGRNGGDRMVRIVGVFASEQVGMTYLERNPAPGTEGDPPQPPFEMNARQLASG
jgi:hypothetical protein